jgi:hypothetical protein
VPHQDLLRALAGDTGAASGFGPEPVVALDSLLLFLCHCCAGSLPSRLHMAFWALDRDGRGCLALEQVGWGWGMGLQELRLPADLHHSLAAQSRQAGGLHKAGAQGCSSTRLAVALRWPLAGSPAACGSLRPAPAEAVAPVPLPQVLRSLPLLSHVARAAVLVTGAGPGPGATRPHRSAPQQPHALTTPTPSPPTPLPAGDLEYTGPSPGSSAPKLEALVAAAYHKMDAGGSNQLREERMQVHCCR